MRKILVLLVVGLFAFVGTTAFADDADVDKATMDALMAKVDTGEMTVEQALASAIDHGVSFAVIVDTCQTRGIALSTVITAAASVGVSSEVVLAKMADAGVTKEQMSAAISQAAGQTDPAYGYTPPEPTQKIPAVVPPTTSPEGTSPSGSVSPSTL